MNAHNGVVTAAANETHFLAVVRAAMIMIDHAISNREPLANRRPIEPTSKIHPLATITRPRLAAKGDGDRRGDHGLFEFSEMLTNHNCAAKPSEAFVEPTPHHANEVRMVIRSRHIRYARLGDVRHLMIDLKRA